MFRYFKKSLAIMLSVVLIVCALPISTFAAPKPEITISANVTNGVEDKNVSFDYMIIIINGEPYNATVKGSNAKDYTITDGKLTLPYDVSLTIGLADGDTYSAKRLAYSSGKYKPVDESEVKSGTIATTSYYLTLDGKKTEISQSEYNAATNNGANETIVLYLDKEGNKYSESEVAGINGYTIIQHKPMIGATTYSMDEYSGYYLKSTLETHSVNIGDVSCNHSRANNFAGLNKYSNSLTGYFDGVADEPKTSGASNQASLNGCKDNLQANSYRVYYDHAGGYAD